MKTKIYGRRQEIRYSEAFKMEVVRELEVGGLAFDAVALKYGIWRQDDRIQMGPAVWQWQQRKGDSSGKAWRDQ